MCTCVFVARRGARRTVSTARPGQTSGFWVKMEREEGNQQGGCPGEGGAWEGQKTTNANPGDRGGPATFKDPQGRPCSNVPDGERTRRCIWEATGQAHSLGGHGGLSTKESPVSWSSYNNNFSSKTPLTKIAYCPAWLCFSGHRVTSRDPIIHTYWVRWEFHSQHRKNFGLLPRDPSWEQKMRRV